MTKGNADMIPIVVEQYISDKTPVCIQIVKRKKNIERINRSCNNNHFIFPLSFYLKAKKLFVVLLRAEIDEFQKKLKYKINIFQEINILTNIGKIPAIIYRIFE